ncbi:restriction endonuclease subunit S [Pedobacter sp. UBA4863]|uniref:restriction endonuclease subunit S n=1 Tax=Pedobacter sp. UBA4863 TaxID=1947060 RepID=UPI0025D3BEE4|nr:restriction endonuclease subunit S [Pedobacter sp. UBA4863]
MENKDIPTHWKWVTLDEIFVTSSGGTPDRKNFNYYVGDIPWVKSGELNYNTITETDEYITQEAIDYSSAKVFPKGSLLIALYGNTVGRMAFLGVDAATNQAVASITSFLINTKYLYYYLMSCKEELLNKREGSAQPNISQKVLNKFLFPLAPLEEQNAILEKIEELFSELDSISLNFESLKSKSKIYWLSEINSFLKGQKHYTILSKVNIKPQKKLEEIIEKRVSLGKKYTGRSNIDNKKIINYTLPNHWRLAKLSDLYVDPVDSISDGPFGSNLKSDDFQETGFPVLKIQNIDRNKFISKDISYVSEEKFNKLEKHQFQNGDVIITKLGSPLGKACIVPANFNKGIIVADLIRIKKNEYINSKFLMYSLNSPYIISQIEKLAKGTTRQRVTLRDVRNLIIIFPSIEEQELIVASIEELDDEINILTDVVNQSSLNVQALKQKILLDAFSGNLINYDINKANVTKYLEKILVEKERFLNKIKKQQKKIVKTSRINSDMDLLEVLKKEENPISSHALWQKSIYKSDIEEFYKKLKELDTKIRELKDGHLSFIELIK